MALTGELCLQIPYEVSRLDRIDMDDSRVLRLVADWLDAQPAETRVGLAAYMAGHANPDDSAQ